jgi:hypothetical protein
VNLGEALAAALAAAFPSAEPATPVTAPRGRTARMRALEDAYGSPAAAAAAVGVKPRTWKLWKTKDARPLARNLRRLDAESGRLYSERRRRSAVVRLRRAFQAATKARQNGTAGGSNVRICAVIYWGGLDTRYLNRADGGQRCTNLDPIPLDHLVDPWLAGDLQALSADFELAVFTEYGTPVFFAGDDVTATLGGI